jgi:hypothetical protein
MGRLILAATALLLSGVAVRAETPGADGPCLSAIDRFCKDTPRGDGRLRACLLAHEAELPAECRARISGAKGPTIGPREMDACRKDLQTHCAGVASGGGRLRACLQEHAGVVSAACKGALARTPTSRR